MTDYVIKCRFYRAFTGYFTKREMTLTNAFAKISAGGVCKEGERRIVRSSSEYDFVTRPSNLLEGRDIGKRYGN
jgi:hypothetical protein